VGARLANIGVAKRGKVCLGEEKGTFNEHDKVIKKIASPKNKSHTTEEDQNQLSSPRK